MADGVSFAGNGGDELKINNFKTIPDEPSMQSASEGSFADNGGGDMVNKAFGTNQRQGIDGNSHDSDSGKGVEFIKDLR